jgi:branched-chain amino acid transport system ATP-binding protein
MENNREPLDQSGLTCVPTKRESCLRLEGVSKNFEGLLAVEDVSFEISSGERRAVIGPNGAGKTTLFNLIAGNLSPTRGKVFLLGENITKLPCHRRAHKGIARTYQITNLFFNLPVIDNLVLAAQALERTKFSLFRPITSYRHLYEKGLELLSWIGMETTRDELVKNLSYGVQRQIEILLALTKDPRLLLLDEPTAGLSPAEAAMMVEILKRLPSHITFLIIEHDMDVAFELAEFITVLHHGKVVADGSIDAIRGNRTVQEIYLGVQ